MDPYTEEFSFNSSNSSKVIINAEFHIQVISYLCSHFFLTKENPVLGLNINRKIWKGESYEMGENINGIYQSLLCDKVWGLRAKTSDAVWIFRSECGLALSGELALRLS